MKITLINISPHEMTIAGYGVRILAACLKRAGHDVETVFLHKNVGERYEERTLDDLAQLATDSALIGISLMTDNFGAAVDITRKIKKRLEIPIIWGGVHPTVMPLECLEHADIVCLGEGEETFVELARQMEEGKGLHNIPGLWFKENGTIIKNELRPLLVNLDSLPFQDYDYETHHMLWEGRIRKINEEMMKVAASNDYLTLTARGCPFKCTYCFNHTFHEIFPQQTKIRTRSIDNVINELREIKERLPFIRRIMIDDDAFFVRPVAELADFSEKYKKEIGINLWISGATPSTATKEKLTILIEGGMTSLRIGVQSASERIKELYRRTHSNQKVLDTVKMISREFKDKLDFVSYDIILDNPWETDADLVTTLRFLARFPTPYVLNLFPLTFYPGTELYEKAKRENIISASPEEAARRSSHRFKETYLNALFCLLKESSQLNIRISPLLMFLLTNQQLMDWGVSEPLFHLLQKRTIWVNLFREGMKDLARGDISRIGGYLKKRTGLA